MTTGSSSVSPPYPPRPRRPRPSALLRPPALALTALLLGGGSLPAQVPLVDGVQRLLAASEAESVLGGVLESLETRLAALAGPERAARARAVAAVHFHPDSLQRRLALVLRQRAGSGPLQEAVRLVEEGSMARVHQLADSLAPAQSLEAYLDSLRSSPPPRERQRLVATLARVQSAGEFFVLIESRTDEAARAMARALGAEAEAGTEPTQADLAQRANIYLRGATLSFLYRYDPVPDTLLRAALDEWRSPAGAWYVAAYMEAVGEAIRQAGEQAAGELREGGGSGPVGA